MVDLRIGILEVPREIDLEIDNDQRDEMKSRLEAALSGAIDVLWITDRRGREVAVPTAKIAYVELGAADGGRHIGFGG